MLIIIIIRSITSSNSLIYFLYCDVCLVSTSWGSTVWSGLRERGATSSGPSYLLPPPPTPAPLHPPPPSLREPPLPPLPPADPQGQVDPHQGSRLREIEGKEVTQF